MKNLFNSCVRKVSENKGEESVNATLLTVIGVLIVSVFMAVVVAAARRAMNASAIKIDALTNEITNTPVTPPTEG